MSLLRVENISYTYQSKEIILNNISFELSAGETLGVLGPNGGGKSTLLKILVGLLPKQNGTILFNGKDTDQFGHPHDFYSYVPQNDQLNLSLPVRISDYLHFSTDRNDPKRVDEILEIVGLKALKNQLISELSGGQKQRVLIARAILKKPKIIFLDEPTKGLDSNGQDQLLNLIKNLQLHDQTAVMIVDHNINQVIKNCHKILCLNRLLHWHDKSDLLTKNILENVYHCEFEHLLIHDRHVHGESPDHSFCDHDHEVSQTKEVQHPFIRRKK